MSQSQDNTDGKPYRRSVTLPSLSTGPGDASPSRTNNRDVDATASTEGSSVKTYRRSATFPARLRSTGTGDASQLGTKNRDEDKDVTSNPRFNIKTIPPWRGSRAPSSMLSTCTSDASPSGTKDRDVDATASAKRSSVKTFGRSATLPVRLRSSSMLSSGTGDASQLGTKNRDEDKDVTSNPRFNIKTIPPWRGPRAPSSMLSTCTSDALPSRTKDRDEDATASTERSSVKTYGRSATLPPWGSRAQSSSMLATGPGDASPLRMNIPPWGGSRAQPSSMLATGPGDASLSRTNNRATQTSHNALEYNLNTSGRSTRLGHSTVVTSSQVAEEKTDQYVSSAFVKEVLSHISPGVASVAALAALAEPLYMQVIAYSAPEDSGVRRLAALRYNEFVSRIFWFGVFGLAFLLSRLSIPALPTWLTHYRRCCFIIDEVIGIPCLFIAFSILCWLISEKAAIGVAVVLSIALILRFGFLLDCSWWKRVWKTICRALAGGESHESVSMV